VKNNGDNQVNISILGSSFTIRADEDKEYLERVIEYVKSKVHTISHSASTRDPLQISILSSILIADELFKVKENSKRAEESDNAKDSAEIERITKQLISQIDNVIEK